MREHRRRRWSRTWSRRTACGPRSSTSAGCRRSVNDAEATAELAAAAASYGGQQRGRDGTEQSLGGEDFAWYLQTVPGAMARLGTRTPGGPIFDLHQGDLRVDDAACRSGPRCSLRRRDLARPPRSVTGRAGAWRAVGSNGPVTNR